MIETEIPETTEESVLQPPQFEGLLERMCSRYARLAAKTLFGFNYRRGDAWDLVRFNDILWDRQSDSETGWEEKAPPGSILCIYYPRSRYNHETCAVEDAPVQRRYTHVALYVGNGVIFHQFGREQIRSNVHEFIDSNEANVVAVIFPYRKSLQD